MKPDFEKAAKEHVKKEWPYWSNSSVADFCEKDFLAGCEHAYSIDKETIERLEKENAELKAFIRGDIKRIEIDR